MCEDSPDHRLGERSEEKVAANMKQTAPLVSSCCCCRPEAPTYDSFRDHASQEEQREISAGDQSDLMKIQIDRSHNWTALCQVLVFMVPLGGGAL